MSRPLAGSKYICLHHGSLPKVGSQANLPFYLGRDYVKSNLIDNISTGVSSWNSEVRPKKQTHSIAYLLPGSDGCLYATGIPIVPGSWLGLSTK